MIDRRPYYFATLRYIHDIVTGEFVNVGIVLVCPNDEFVGGQFRTSMGRIKYAFPDMNSYAFQSSMKAIRAGLNYTIKHCAKRDLVDGHVAISRILQKIMKHDDSCLQWSSVSTGLSSEEPKKILERLYQSFVGKYDKKSIHRKTDDDIWRPVKKILQNAGIRLDLSEKTIEGDTDEVTFKHAWKNGTWHAYEPVSFDLSSEEGIRDKARKWRGQLEASAEGARENVALHFILGSPSDEKLRNAFSDAIKILEHSPFDPKIFLENDTDILIENIIFEFEKHMTN